MVIQNACNLEHINVLKNYIYDSLSVMLHVDIAFNKSINVLRNYIYDSR